MIAGIFKSSLSAPTLGSFVVLRLRLSTSFTPFTVTPIRQVCQSSFVQGGWTQPNNSSSASDNTRQATKDFKDMPGPWKIPLLGITPEFIKMDPKRLIQEFAKLPQKYGKIFKIKFVPGMPEFVCLFDPEDAKAVFRSEGKYPQRFPIDIWNESRTAQGKPVGLFLL